MIVSSGMERAIETAMMLSGREPDMIEAKT